MHFTTPTSQSSEITLNKENWYWIKMMTNTSKKKQTSFSLCSCDVSYVTFCSELQQGAWRRRHLNNPARFCPSRAKAHCPGGNKNILEMKHTFSLSSRLNFWQGFSSALSLHRSGLARHPRLSFLLDVLSTHFFFFFPLRIRRGCNFITDPEGDCLRHDQMCLNYTAHLMVREKID